jgi:hypothetical protein
MAGLEALQLPGLTRNFGNPENSQSPVIDLAKLAPTQDRKIILLATATITMDNVFSNGLFQNVYVLECIAK